MTFPGGLLDQSAVARLLASMQGPSNNVPQAPQGLMAPQLPEPVPLTPGRSTSPGGDPTHEHRSGIRGGLLHAVGADRVAPELAALLTPDQQKRVKPGLLATIGNAAIFGRGPQAVMQGRASNLLGLQDTKKARDLTAQQQQMMAQIQQVASTMPEQEGLEYTARMFSRLGLGEFDKMAQAAERLRPVAPPRTTPDEPQIVPTVNAKGEPVLQGVLRDGTVVWEKPAQPNVSAGQAMTAQREFTRVNQLRDDYANNPTVKQAAAYASAYQGIVAASQDENPQTSLAMMYEAVKMRDPNAVREGELALQRKARSVPTWLYAMWDKAANGNVLTAGEKQQILAWAKEKVVQQSKIVEPIQREFGATARRYGVQADSSFIAPSPFAGIDIAPDKYFRPNPRGDRY